MPFGALRAVLPATLHKVNRLVAFDLIDHIRLHSSICHHRRPNNRAFATNHQYIVKLNCLSSICSQFFNAEHIARLNFILLTTGFKNRKHIVFLLLPRSLASLSGRFGWQPPRTARPIRRMLDQMQTHPMEPRLLSSCCAKSRPLQRAFL